MYLHKGTEGKPAGGRQADGLRYLGQVLRDGQNMAPLNGLSSAPEGEGLPLRWGMAGICPERPRGAGSRQGPAGPLDCLAPAASTILEPQDQLSHPSPPASHAACQPGCPLPALPADHTPCCPLRPPPTWPAPPERAAAGRCRPHTSCREAGLLSRSRAESSSGCLYRRAPRSGCRTGHTGQRESPPENLPWDCAWGAGTCSS